MSTTLMPPLEIDAVSAGEIEAWVRITAEGSLCFFRRAGSGDMEVSAILPRAGLFPTFVSEYYVAALFVPQELKVPTYISAVCCDSNMPEEIANMPQSECMMVWHLEQDEFAGAGRHEVQDDLTGWQTHEHTHDHPHEHTHEDEPRAHEHIHEHIR